MLRVRNVDGVPTNVVNKKPIGVGNGGSYSIANSMIKANTKDYSATQFIGSGNNSPETWIPLASSIGSGSDVTISCFLPSNPFYNYYGAGFSSSIGLLYLYSTDTYATWFILGSFYDSGPGLCTILKSYLYGSIWCTRNGGGGYGNINMSTQASAQTPNHFVLTRINGAWSSFWNGVKTSKNSTSTSLTAGGGTNFTHLVICPSRQSKLRAEIFEDLCVIRGSVWKSNFSKPTDYLPDDLSRYLG